MEAAEQGGLPAHQGDKEKRPREIDIRTNEERDFPPSKRSRSSLDAKDGGDQRKEMREGRSDDRETESAGRRRTGEHSRSSGRDMPKRRSARSRSRSRSRESARRRERKDRDRSRSRSRSRSRERRRYRRRSSDRSRSRSRSPRRRVSRRGRSRRRSRSSSRERSRDNDSGNIKRSMWDNPPAATQAAPRLQAPAPGLLTTPFNQTQLHAALLANPAGLSLTNMPALLASLASQQAKTQAVEQKKKLLWSSKKTEAAVSSTAATWTNADLGDASRKEKFLKLMGAKKQENAVLLQQTAQTTATTDPSKSQDKLFQELEREFMTGLGQGTSSKGLGFNW